MIVDSVGRQTVNGRNLRWLRVHQENLPGNQPTFNRPWPGRIYEGIGAVGRYLQTSGYYCGGTDPGYMGSLLCFRATGQATYYPPANVRQSCTTILSSVGQQTTRYDFEAYPNPTDGPLEFRQPAGPAGASYTLHDLTGRCLQTGAVPGTQRLSLAELPSGVYILGIRLAGGNKQLVRRVARY
ncbi:T9SS type A sorting domain-containing protein [Hymenobacter koreensis]|uniref:T9SS type A sorting domain-containing protein n=1 Tax=Hymenobacter koreensis TaxID=1084523 RepID=A0ABP8IYM8_9BACT